MVARERLCSGTVLLLLALSVACRTSLEQRMVRIPPPRNWARDLASSRAARDDFFRTDPESPLLAADKPGFKGLDYWEPRERYYFAGSMQLFARPERLTLITTAGQTREGEKVGRILFELDGQQLALQVYRLLDSDPRLGGDSLFLPFMDATTGRETYPAGRYVNLRGRPGGPYVLDFNRAFNPSCAYGAPERFACPVTPSENRLPVPIEAGERGYKHKELEREG